MRENVNLVYDGFWKVIFCREAFLEGFFRGSVKRKCSGCKGSFPGD